MRLKRALETVLRRFGLSCVSARGLATAVSVIFEQMAPLER
jgi:hypothetical protein